MRNLVAACALAALAAGAAWAPLFPWRGVATTRLWRAYRPLLVRADVASARGLDAISRALGPGVVSEATATVEFWDFSGLARVPFSEVSARLDPMDPRFDAWMAGAGRFFRTASGGAEWQVLYVPASTSLPRFWLLATGSLGVPWQGEWRIPELDLLEKLLALATIAVFPVLLGFSFKNGRRMGLIVAMAGAALSAGLVASGGLAALGACLIVLMTWSTLLRVLVDRKPGRLPLAHELRRPLAMFTAASVAGSLLLLLARPPLAAPLVGFLGLSVGLLLLIVSLAVLGGSTGRQGRSVFEPVPILRPLADRAQPAAPLAAAVLLALCTLVPVARGTPLPVPSSMPGFRDYTWQSLAALARSGGPASLPDLADLVTHDAYQETLGFGRAWRLPVSDERVYAREFVTSGSAGTIAQRLRIVKVFDAAWLDSVRTRALPGSLEAMLFAERRPVSVAVLGPGTRLLPQLPGALAALCLLLSGLRKDLNRRPLIRAIYLRFNTLARRKQVP